tara:strand:- start:637 stop:855 length:219 start_codon:yes stop_codon:yes gene_type:complete
MSLEGCIAHRNLSMDSNVYEVCEGVFIAGDSQTGNVNVSSNETNRYQIVHAKIFEKNIIQHYEFEKMTRQPV